jgi:RND superfamily putative drug exporter
MNQLDNSDVGAGLTEPVEILTDDPGRTQDAVAGLDGVAGVIAPDSWHDDGTAIVDAWTAADTSTETGSAVAADIRDTAENTGARVGGTPAYNADFVSAIYGNAWWLGILIGVVTFALLTWALRSVLLPLKALVLDVLSLAAAYGVTVLIWQFGYGSELLFGQSAADAITVWVPVAAFAFLFGLSMDYEVFLLTRIREEYDDDRHVGWGTHRATDNATALGVGRTGWLVTSAALILFLSFIALSRIPVTEVKMLATTLALGIIIDATIVRGVLAPALVAAMGRANWWLPGRRRKKAGSDREEE